MSLLLLFNQVDDGTTPVAPGPNNPDLGNTVLMPGGKFFSRKRFEEFEEAERARIAAERRAQTLKAKPKQALEEAAEVAEEAIAQAGILGEIILKPLTRALQAATAAKPVEVEARAATVINIAENLLRAMEEDEEEVMLLMWAME